MLAHRYRLALRRSTCWAPHWHTGRHGEAIARSFADIRDNIETAAEARASREAQGAALIARFDAEMATARAAAVPRAPTAILFIRTSVAP